MEKKHRIRYDLVKYLYALGRWSDRAFGSPKEVNRTGGVIDHIEKELEEVEAKPHDIEEWIDIANLAFDGARRNGATPEEIAAILDNKLRKNEKREWPDWRDKDPNKAIEHIRKLTCSNEGCNYGLVTRTEIFNGLCNGCLFYNKDNRKT